MDACLTKIDFIALQHSICAGAQQQAQF